MKLTEEEKETARLKSFGIDPRYADAQGYEDAKRIHADIKAGETVKPIRTAAGPAPTATASSVRDATFRDIEMQAEQKVEETRVAMTVASERHKSAEIELAAIRRVRARGA